MVDWEDLTSMELRVGEEFRGSKLTVKPVLPVKVFPLIGSLNVAVMVAVPDVLPTGSAPMTRPPPTTLAIGATEESLLHDAGTGSRRPFEKLAKAKNNCG